MDEIGLLYRGLQNKRSCLSNESCVNEKFSKERLTIAIYSNMTSTDKDKPLIIGKSIRPICFGRLNTENLQIFWRANKKI